MEIKMSVTEIEPIKTFLNDIRDVLTSDIDYSGHEVDVIENLENKIEEIKTLYNELYEELNINKEE